MRDKGAAVEVRVLVHDLPEVVVEQEYQPCNEPMPYEPAGDFGSGGDAWVDQHSDDKDGEEEEEEGEEGEEEVERAARKVRVEYRDFCTKRERTDTSNKYWEEQKEGMVDAYMDWCLRSSSGEGLPLCDKPSLWIDVVDVFGTYSF